MTSVLLLFIMYVKTLNIFITNYERHEICNAMQFLLKLQWILIHSTYISENITQTTFYLIFD